MTFKNFPDKCPLCGGAKKEGKTTFTVDLGFGATVCSQCGADWIEDSISARLEGIVNEARTKHHLVEVTTMTA